MSLLARRPGAGRRGSCARACSRAATPISIPGGRARRRLTSTAAIRTSPTPATAPTNCAPSRTARMLAVNSPRHCAHNEATPGEPLDPLCNACVEPRLRGRSDLLRRSRATPSIRGALAWDRQCVDRCATRSAAAAPGRRAVADWARWRRRPDSAPPVFLRGAVGSFEGIVTERRDPFAEGWACDPDFPAAFSPVQISVGGALGAAGATLATVTADQPLAPAGATAVAAACGGAGRHGFRVRAARPARRARTCSSTAST